MFTPVWLGAVRLLTLPGTITPSYDRSDTAYRFIRPTETFCADLPTTCSRGTIKLKESKLWKGIFKPFIESITKVQAWDEGPIFFKVKKRQPLLYLPYLCFQKDYFWICHIIFDILSTDSKANNFSKFCLLALSTVSLSFGHIFNQGISHSYTHNLPLI